MNDFCIVKISIGDLQERLESFGPVRLEWPNMDNMPIHRNSPNSKKKYFV
jgi:hypothetical protein